MIMKHPGPPPDKRSLKQNSVKKAFYVQNKNWNIIEKYSKTQNKSKSSIVNEALELMFTQLYGTNVNGSGTDKWKVISLFSGCGGMDLGFEGGFSYLEEYYPVSHDLNETKEFEVVFANDILHEACTAYEEFFCQQRGGKTYIHEGDIANFLDNLSLLPTEKRERIFPSECDVVIGGFPCQDFSVAGKRKGLTEERGRLYLQMKRVIELTNPLIFIAENVKGLTNLESALDIISTDFANTGKHGYTIEHKLHMAADYGVPQTRERVFICGVRGDVNQQDFRFPEETHSIDRETELLPWVTAHEGIRDLTENHPNQSQYSKAKNYGSHCQGNKAIRPDYPSPTIRAEHHGNIEFHYSEKRRLSVRECARIQSFPDDFIFRCSPSKAYRIIGNAVPPVLAWHIAQSVAKALKKWEEKNTPLQEEPLEIVKSL